MQLYELKEIEERVILIGVQTGGTRMLRHPWMNWKSWQIQQEPLPPVRVIQSREAVHPGTYIGKGKIEEVRSLMLAVDATWHYL